MAKVTLTVDLSRGLQLFGGLQEIYTALNDFGGDNNRLPINGGVLRTEEPRGPQAGPNAAAELVGVPGSPTAGAAGH